MRRILAAALLGAALAMPAMAQERSIRLVSGYAAGGASDLVARFAAEAMAPLLGARVVVENRTGANGVIGAAEVARSTPDGNTLYQCPMSPLAIAPQLVGASLPLDPGEALAPVANLALSSYGFVVSARGPYTSVQDVLAAARARPGQVIFGSAGVGSAQHLAGELLKQKTGLDMVHNPYRGATPAVVDILGGRVDFMITNLADIARQVQDGTLRLLALGDSGGSPVFPETRPLAEAVPGFDVTGWFGICGPRGLPAEVAGRLEAALRQAMADGTLPRRLAENGLTPLFEDAATLARRIESDRRTWREVIRAVGVRAE